MAQRYLIQGQVLVPLREGTQLLGRATECDIVIDNETVSRTHARIDLDREKVIVRDLKSLNGTFVNCRRITTSVVVVNDRLQFGSVFFRLYDPDSRDDDESTEQFPRLSGESLQLLSPAQKRVLKCLLRGDGDKQAARQLDISPQTVHGHVNAIFRRLNVHSRGDLLSRFIDSDPLELG